jgi:hypothetical protein
MAWFSCCVTGEQDGRPSGSAAEEVPLDWAIHTGKVIPLHVAMLLYSRLTQLDLTDPFEVFARVPELKIDLVWKERKPVRDAFGLELSPTNSFEEALGGTSFRGRRTSTEYLQLRTDYAGDCRSTTWG